MGAFLFGGPGIFHAVLRIFSQFLSEKLPSSKGKWTSSRAVVLTIMQMNIPARKIEQPFYCHVTDCYPRVFSSFDRLACDHGVYHPYFSLRVRGEATEGTLRGLRRAMDGVGDAAAHSAAPVPASCLAGHAAGRRSGHRLALHVQPLRGSEATTTFDYRCLRLLFLDGAA